MIGNASSDGDDISHLGNASPGRLEIASRVGELMTAVIAASSELSLEGTLYQIIKAACELVDATYGALGVLANGATLDKFVTVGMDLDTEVRIGNRPSGKGVLGLLIQDHKPLRLADLSKHPQASGFPPNHPPMRSFLGVPIMVRGEVFGNLYLTEKRSAPTFSDADEQLTIALAGVAGVAIHNARMHERMAHLSLVEDRERIARDLHDTVIQRLFATGMSLQSLTMLSDVEAMRARIEQAVESLDTTISDIRTTIFDLQGHHAGIRATVLELARSSSETLGYMPKVSFVGPVDTIIEKNVADHLTATLREALANVVRHAQANSVSISVSAGKTIALTVEDDGTGISLQRKPDGRGLNNMAERAELLGGSLVVQPANPKGTVVLWSVPNQ